MHFAAFLAAVLCVYWLLPGRRIQNAALVGASLVFYCWGDARFVGLVLLCAATGFVCGIAMEGHRRHARRILLAGAAIAFGILFTFKYFDFFIESVTSLSRAVGFEWAPATLGLLLPIGISFFTFQTVGYMIDVYRREIEAERDPIDFLLFVMFFPQLVAGPIERAGNLLRQIKAPRKIDGEDIREGVEIGLRGLVKKLVVADNLAPIVDPLFAQPQLSGPLVFVACLGFAFQIYCDFSGYTDMARGVARLLGFRLSLNFRNPYLATSPTDFWRRWHMTLSTWFRDYVFIPLGGSRRTPGRTALNLFTTFVLSGLWHGASWNFLLWGGFHGLALVAHKHWSASRLAVRLRAERSYPAIAWLGNFALVLYGWMLFRVSGFDAIAAYTHALAFDGRHAELALLLFARLLPFIALTAFVDWTEWAKPRPRVGVFAWLPRPVPVALILTAFVFGAEHGGAFIYFKF